MYWISFHVMIVVSDVRTVFTLWVCRFYYSFVPHTDHTKRYDIIPNNRWKTDMNFKILWYWKVYCSNLNADSSMNQRRNFKLQTSRLVRKKIMLKCFSAACVRAKTLNTKLTIYFFEVFIRKRKIYIGRKIERD